MKITWGRRGRNVYARHHATGPEPLSFDHAARAVVFELWSEFLRLPPEAQDAAVDEAADGYLEAHVAAGGKVGAGRRSSRVDAP
jgi:hypothetical protein